MAGAISDHVAAQILTQEGEIADQIEQFVSSGFIGEMKRIVDE